MKHGTGWPIGPCALIDLIGVDVHVHAPRRCTTSRASRGWRRRRGSSRCGTQGQLGRKTGRGFYTY